MSPSAEGVIPTRRQALVTGASSGIGAAFARALKRRGYQVVLVARRRDRLIALSQELGQDDSTVLVGDLSPAGAADEIAREATRRGFEIDLLVNNAGLGHTSRFDRESREWIRTMLDVNVRAVVEMTHAFLPAMVARGRGQIVNVASNAAFQPVPFLAVYAATKSFVVSFTEGLATELAETGVHFQALCPGLTATEFLDVAETHTGNLLVNKVPSMTPEAVVKASLRGLDAGRLRVIPGFANRALATAQHFLPRSWARRVAGALYRPGGG
jgi:short-subunit dehydrogenase